MASHRQFASLDFEDPWGHDPDTIVSMPVHVTESIGRVLRDGLMLPDIAAVHVATVGRLRVITAVVECIRDYVLDKTARTLENYRAHVQKIVSKNLHELGYETTAVRVNSRGVLVQIRPRVVNDLTTR